MNTKETIVTAIEDDIAKEQIGIDLFNKLVEIFKPFEGKQITKRLATAVEKAMPEYTVSYRADYGHYKIMVWGNGIDFNERRDFLIGYDDNPIYREGSADENHSGFRNYSGCHGFYAEERNRKRKQNLVTGDVDTIAQDIDAYIEAKAKLEKYNSINFPSWYSVESAMGIKKR